MGNQDTLEEDQIHALDGNILNVLEGWMKKMDFLGGPPPPPPPTVIPLPPPESQLYSPTQVRTGELCTVHCTHR